MTLAFDLYLHHDFFGAILLDDSGPEWSNQCGGTMCAHPTAKGHFYPLPFTYLPSVDPALDVWIDSIHEPEAQRLRDLLAQLPDDGIELDLSHEGPCGEAWIPVRFNPGYNSALEQLRGRRAILTYANSD